MSMSTLQHVMKNAGKLARRLSKRAAPLANKALDADRWLQRSMAALIDLRAARYPTAPGEEWAPGEPLRLLLAGYAGSRNTGADVRVEEMIHQFRWLFGDEHLALSILTIEPSHTRGYFKTVRQIEMPQIFPKFLFDVVHHQHGVIACEGSMFKSKFANALSTLMVGALGLAAAEHKLAIGYGGEAGAMDPSLEQLVRTYCQDAYIIARNDNSVRVLGELGVAAESGTDTAWTFEPAPAEVGRQALLDAGWDGEKPIVALCPINPFWWPVKPDIRKGIEHKAFKLHEKEHYRSVYFHHGGREVEDKQDAYLQAIADATNRFAADRDVFVILVGMEMLDRLACEALLPKLTRSASLFISDEHDMYTMISVLHQCSALVSSRYHAIVTSMLGEVPSAGITMDERIRNLMIDRGEPELSARGRRPAAGRQALPHPAPPRGRFRGRARAHRKHGRQKPRAHGSHGPILGRGGAQTPSRVSVSSWIGPRWIAVGSPSAYAPPCGSSESIPSLRSATAMPQTIRHRLYDQRHSNRAGVPR